MNLDHGYYRQDRAGAAVRYVADALVGALLFYLLWVGVFLLLGGCGNWCLRHADCELGQVCHAPTGQCYRPD